MIVATGSIDYLTDQVLLLENLKTEKIKYGDGWNLGEWSEYDEERLNLVKELLKLKRLYFKVEKQLEELEQEIANE